MHLLVLKLDKLIEFNDIQFWNMFFILITLEVLKEDKSIEVNF